MEQRVSGRKSPYAIRSLLGWVLCGPLGEVKNYAAVHYLNVNNSLMEKLREMYDQEFRDTADASETYSMHDKEAMALVENGTRVEGDHFVVPLPWKEDKVIMPNNRQVAEKRLTCLRRRFIHDKDLFRRYTSIIQDHIKKGFIERVPDCSHDTGAVRQWYLPHHPVINPRKPEKLRVVFDCAAKFMGRSLNDYLLQGPNLTANLVDVIIRFRLERIAVAADIEEMFLQVKVPTKDRDALRLLWWPENNLDKEAVEYRLTVHPFGAVSSPFCANYALRRTLDGCKSGNGTSTESVPISSFYVDDYLASFHDVLAARAQINYLTGSLKHRGFRLTKWMSNSRDVILSVPQQERTVKLREISTGPLPVERALGLTWDADSDEFVIKLELPVKPLTRRGILATISSMYDPMGFIAPWLLPGKLLLQELCRKRLGWDEPLGPGDQYPWSNWLITVRQLGELRIPRCVKGCDNEKEVELHLFSDASEIGYGVVAYACYVNEARDRFSSLVFAKARVAPLKTVSIPRLELAAAVLAVRVSRTIERGWQRGFNRVSFWTDSAIVLYYINNNSSRFHTFVANRISEIHDSTRPKQWRHVRSEDNPADKVSRGLLDISKVQLWLDGPAFLRDSPAQWPQCLIPEKIEGAEEKKAAIHLSSVHREDSFLGRFGKYSTWTSLLNALAWLTRYKTYCILMRRPSSGDSVRVGRLKLNEIRKAEEDLLVLVQKEAFGLEVIKPGVSKNTNAKASRLGKLRPLLINGLLCVGGRLTNSLLAAENRHPIILPRNHFVTELVIRHYHMIEGHAGVNHVLTAVRQRFWIVHGTETVKRTIRRCPLCRRQNAVGMKQLMAPLPAVRVKEGWHPFSQVGLDYFGPIEVKRGRSTEKRYGCIITCLQSRAVHLEVAHSMSTDSFIMLLMRFVGRRGPPTDLYSDNGSNFTYANKELKKWLSDLNQLKINAKLTSRGVQWHFNPPYASHRGGVWERLIRMVRRILTAICTEQVLDDEGLLSVIVEAERIMNNRPIAPVVHSDPEAAALTPNHLILLRQNQGLQLKETVLERYHARWKQANHLANVFWKRWSREYLSALQGRQKWMVKERNLREGDVVLVITESSPRGKWPIGIVARCFPDADGLVRTVEVRTCNGLIKRDIRQLSFLEGEGSRLGGNKDEGAVDG